MNNESQMERSDDVLATHKVAENAEVFPDVAYRYSRPSRSPDDPLYGPQQIYLHSVKIGKEARSSHSRPN